MGYRVNTFNADGVLADALEKHEETANADLARRIGGETWERGDVLAIYSRPDLGTGLNFACRVRSDAASIENLVDAVSAWMQTRGVEPHFRVSPLTRPSDLASVLASRGFERTEMETQMVLAVEDIAPPPNPRVTVEPVSPLDLPRWVALQHHGFGGTGDPSDSMMDIARSAASAGNSMLYLARLDGAPAGAGVLTGWAGVFGIYGVATAQAARKQGVATALVRHMVREVRARGNAPLCLQVETGGETQRWYERLGFRVVYDRTGWTRRSAIV